MVKTKHWDQQKAEKNFLKNDLKKDFLKLIKNENFGKRKKKVKKKKKNRDITQQKDTHN